jgi:hypothetical protein
MLPPALPPRGDTALRHGNEGSNYYLPRWLSYDAELSETPQFVAPLKTP